MKPNAMIFIAASKQKIEVITASNISRTNAFYPLGSSSGFSMAKLTLDAKISTMMIASNAL